jgi:hypothetical protein
MDNATGFVVSTGTMNAIASAVDTLIQRHGSLRAAAKAIGVDHAYLWRLERGIKTRPSDEVLQKLGLKRSVKITRATSNGAKRQAAR